MEWALNEVDDTQLTLTGNVSNKSGFLCVFTENEIKYKIKENDEGIWQKNINKKSKLNYRT